ncbi:MAG: hypothetical protein ACJ762_02775 [Solirubrobacteraceae bacterium]
MRLLAVTVVAFALLTPSAHALGIGIGTPPGGLSPFRPGATATATGTMVITLATSSWTLTVADGTSGTTNPGHLKRGATCTSGVTYLAQPLTIEAAPLIGSATPSPARSLSGTAQTLATGPATATATITTNFSQVIGSSEVLQQACIYGATVTFTLT